MDTIFEFNRTGYSAIPSADSENPTTEHDVDRIPFRGDMAIRNSTYHEGYISEPTFVEGRSGEVIDRSYDSKERWWFFLPARRYAIARVFATATCLSVRPSVTRRYCVKKKKASVMISSLSGSATILVFWCQISSWHSKGFPRAGAQGWENQPFSSFNHQYLENGSR